MFRSAQVKLAHNTTIPNLGGNKDLRPLQDLIIAEKAVVQSLQRLSADLAKSNECLRTWAFGEGDDLGDVLSSSSTILGHIAFALTQYSNHEQVIREYMKAIRTREENLDDLRRRRRALVAKADSAEKKLSKMSPEHKSIQQQTELLNSLRYQIRSMDSEILTEEAGLSDFKRLSAKNWMILKFGGLLEFAEKSTIVGDLGKLMLEEIPLDASSPGLGRPFYTGRERTEKLVSEALRCIGEVTFDPQSIDSAPSRSFPAIPASQSVSHLQEEAVTASDPEHFDGNEISSYRTIDGMPSTTTLRGESQFRNHAGRIRSASGPQGRGNHQQTPSSVLGGGSLGLDSYITNGADEFGVREHHNESKGYETMPALGGSNFSSGEAGSNFTTPSSSRFTGAAGGTGGRFASFPVRKASLNAVEDQEQPPPPPPPVPQQPHAELTSQPTLRKLSFGSPSSQVDIEDSSFAAEVENALARRSGEPPAPNYESHKNDSRLAEPVFTGLPKGAAPPAPWGATPSHLMSVPIPQGSSSDAHRISGDESILNAHAALRDRDTYGIIEEDEDETQLPYANLDFDSNRRDRQSRHVKFEGDATGANEVEPEQSPQKHTSFDSRRDSLTSSNQSYSVQENRSTSPRQDDTAATRAAAAREVSRELDALSFNPPHPGSGGVYTLNSSFVPPPGPPPLQRLPSPVITPAPLFVQAQVPSGENHEHDSQMGVSQPTSSTIPPDEDRLSISSNKAEVGTISASASESATTLSGAVDMGMKPTLNLNFGSSLSVGSTNSFGTPPEYPAATSPLSINTTRMARTPSPLPSSASATTPPAGPRTISAAAFKRTAQLRSTSSSSIDNLSSDKRVSSPGLAGVGAGMGIGGAPYSDVKPLSVVKRPLPSSPYPPQPLGPESPVSSVTRSGTPFSEQLESTGSGSGKGYESSISQDGYTTEDTNGRVASSPRGYGQERFVTKLGE